MQQQENQMPLDERITALVGRLQKEADERVSQKSQIEQRWIEDLQQYHGKYDENTAKRIKEQEGSELFINLTRPKTTALAAKLFDLLFPTDDKNWGIEPTPDPTLSKDAERAAEAAFKRKAAVVEGNLPPEQKMALVRQVRAIEDYQEKIASKQEEAKKRSQAMSVKMDDQLKECDYQAQMRDVIEDGSKLGAGVIKGPIVTGKTKRSWGEMVTESGQVIPVLQASQEINPTYRRVDPWNYFPDPDARNPQDGEGDYERHLLNKKALRKLARQPGFDANAIYELLSTEAKGTVPNALTQLRSILDEGSSAFKDRFIVWEYTGPIEPQEFRDLELGYGEPEEDEVDELQEVHAVIWFCEGKVLKYEIHPFDSGDSIYSIFCLERDEVGPWGYGIPFMMRDSQSALNAAWRMMMDNGGNSIGPQIVANKELIEPQDGKWELKRNKVWLAKNGMPGQTQAPFSVYNLDNNQAAYANIAAMAIKHIDDETAVPAALQGDPGTQPQQTAMATAIMSNNSNVIFRRIVKNFDDDVTIPNIKRLYDWNMQHSDDEGIKGDMQVVARGSSVLLVREMQAKTLIAIAMQLGTHPIYGPMFKHHPLITKIVTSHMIAANDVMMTEDEWKQSQQPKEDAGPDIAAFKMQLEQMKLQLQKTKIDADFAKTQLQSDTTIQKAMIERDTELMKLANDMDMAISDIQAKLQDQAEKRASDERRDLMKISHEENKLNAEMQATQIFGPTGGGLM